MQINHINNKPILTANHLQRNCYYKFINLPNYIFIYDKNHPNELIPVVNDDSELKNDYHNFKKANDIPNETIEIITICNISFNIQTKNNYIRRDTLSKYITHKTGFISLFYSNRIYPFMFITINEQLILYNLDDNSPESEKMSILDTNYAFFKQIYINSIDCKSIDNSRIHLFSL